MPNCECHGEPVDPDAPDVAVTPAGYVHLTAVKDSSLDHVEPIEDGTRQSGLSRY